MKLLPSLFLCLLFASFAHAGVHTEEVDYTAGGTTLKGFLAYDDSTSVKRPGVLVVHEWWGHNRHARERATMLAELGYTALAVDMYGDGKTADHPQKAGEFMNAAFQNWDASKARYMAAYRLLQSHETVDPERIGSIGFCFGGAVSLRMAREGADLDGVVAFHAALPLEPTIQPGSVKAAVLVINGADDTFLKPETVTAFKKSMTDAHVDFEYRELPGIKHSFTNRQADEFSQKFNIPNLQYDRDADTRSWAALKDFFQRVFAK